MAKATVRTSSGATKVRRGFTLIELSVVIVALAVIAAIVSPRIRAMEASREYRDFRLGLRRIATSAREAAVSRNRTVELSVDDSEGVVLATAVGAEGDELVLARLPIPSNVTITRATIGGSDTGSAEWRLPLYADGKSDGGGVEFEANGEDFYLAVLDDGQVQFGDGGLPSQVNQKWQAGELEQRQ